MNVALCGTHGIGKSTLLEAVWERLVRSPLYEDRLGEKLQEVARSVAKEEGLRTLADIQQWPSRQIEYFQWRVLMGQVSEERWATRDLGGFISDRSVVDNLAYMYFYKCSDPMLKAVTDFCRLHVQHYDVLFYIPVPVQFDTRAIADGFRMTELESVMAVDEIIVELFADFGCDVVNLSVDRAKWVDEVCDEIDNFCLTSA